MLARVLHLSFTPAPLAHPSGVRLFPYPTHALTMTRHWRDPTNYATMLQSRQEIPMSEPTKEELMAKIAELEKKVEGRKKGTLEFRVGEKGGVSVYGLGRFPVTLYYEQWVRLLDMAKDLREFLEENKHRLKLKDQ
jgi:hypothetical protein